MNTRITKDLDKAKALYKELKIAEAYPLFRRFYDRLPFTFLPEHAECFGMFIRILFELGKQSELEFYASEFEKISKREQSPLIRYQTVYAMTELGKYPVSYAIRETEDVIRVADSDELKVKAKFLLAHIFDKFSRPADEIISLISHIEKPKDPGLAIYWETWQVKKLRFQKKYPEARALIEKLLNQKEIQQDWYTSFTLKIYLCGTYLDENNPEAAKAHLKEIEILVDEKPLKTCILQKEAIEERIWDRSTLAPITVKNTKEKSVISCGGRSIELNQKNAAEKVLQLMLKKGFINKDMIVKTLYDRAYASEKDDKLIYYHIYGVRDLLNQVGLPRNTIENKDSVYKLNTEVILEEQK